MSDYNARMAAVLLADHERFLARERDELAQLSGIDTGSDSYAHSRNLTGEPSEPNRTHRATGSSWERMARPSWSLVTVTTADGHVVRNVPASAFRAQSAASAHRSSRAAEVVAEQAAQKLHLLESAGFIGNVE